MYFEPARRNKAEVLGADVAGGEFTQGTSEFLFFSPSEDACSRPLPGSMAVDTVDSDM